MAKNTGNGGRRGAVRNRTQERVSENVYVKRERSSGKIVGVKQNPWKGIPGGTCKGMGDGC